MLSRPSCCAYALGNADALLGAKPWYEQLSADTTRPQSSLQFWCLGVSAVWSLWACSWRLRGIEEQLTHEPDVETRNRKPLRRRPAPFGADWEIRFGPANRFRVLYKIAEERREVQVLAIGVKQGNRLLVGGEEMDL